MRSWRILIFDERLVLSGSSQELRWTIATIAALACGTAVLAAAVAGSMIGDHSTYQLATGQRFAHQLVYDFEALRTFQPAARDALPDTPETVHPSDATSERFAGSESRNQCAGQTWPYFTDDCLWAVDAPKRRRVVVRLKSPWCKGELQHRPFDSCRPRPR